MVHARTILLRFGLGLISGLGPAAQGQTLYTFGNPTADEQAYIEFINRARANPPAEGLRLATTTDPDVLSAYAAYGVDLGLLQSELNALSPVPPLAPNAQLTQAARGHTGWMFDTATQAHDQTNPSNTLAERVSAAGYNYNLCGENIFCYAKSAWHGHAGFEVDWGSSGSGGMQAGRGHRANIHNPSFREIGVGVRNGSNTVNSRTVGPQLVTQDLGRQASSPTFGTGVAYYDLDGNGGYDPGEGIAGLTVNVSGASHYCLTADGGGWVVPVPTTATTRTVTFSGLGINQAVNLVVPASTNAKADLKLAYAAPTFTNPATVAAGFPANVSFTPVGGAAAYRWSRAPMSTATAENCDTLDRVTVTKTGTYSILDSTVKYEGTNAFHLLHATAAAQTIELNGLYYAQPGASLSFRSRLRTATSDEVARVQAREEGSLEWQDLYTRAGNGSSGEAAFSPHSVSLAALAGKLFRLRLHFSFTSGSYYNTQNNTVGWFIDDLQFSEVSELATPVTEDLATTSASFTPTAGIYLLTVSPLISNTAFPPGVQILTANSVPPGYAAWAATMEAAAALPAGTIATNPGGDPDHDGRDNLLEYAFGLSAVLANEATPRLPSIQPSPTHLVLRYQKDTALADITVTPQASVNLTVWKAPGESGAPAGFSDNLITTVGSLQTREMRVPLGTAATFLRLRVTRP